MIDTLHRNLEKATPLSRILKDAGREGFLSGKAGSIPKFWGGQAATRIVMAIRGWLENGSWS